MPSAKTVVASLLATSGLLLATSAGAAPLNDRSCKPAPGRDPVVVLHGRGGNIEMMEPVTNALIEAGYCTFAMNHGQVNGRGQFGVDHLDVSAQQAKDFVDRVLADTGASKVNVVGHSAGTGVLDNYIQRKGGADKVSHLVSFGGLHHPYAHAGVARFLDASIYLPNLILIARKVVPGIDLPTIVRGAFTLYTIAGGSLAGVDVETATSNMASDLFEPDYWNQIQGGQSEPLSTTIKIGRSERTTTTKDSVPNVCYTNIVGLGDLVTGAAAGFQDEAPNVDNFVLPTPSDHTRILADPIGLAKMLAGIAKPCTPAATPKAFGATNELAASTGESVEDFDGDGFIDDDDAEIASSRTRRDLAIVQGCSAAPSGSSTWSGGLVAGALAALAFVRRRSASR